MTTPRKVNSKNRTQTEAKQQLAHEILQDTDDGILYRMRDNAGTYSQNILTLLGLTAPWGYVPTDIVARITDRARTSLGKGASALEEASSAPMQQIPGFLDLKPAIPTLDAGSLTQEELAELNASRTTGELEFTLHYDVGTTTFTAPPPSKDPEILEEQYNALCAALPMVATEAACIELELLLEVWDIEDSPNAHERHTGPYIPCEGPKPEEIRMRINDLRKANDYPTTISQLAKAIDKRDEELLEYRAQVEGPGGPREKAAFFDWIVEKGTSPDVEPKNFERTLRLILHQAQFMGDDYADILEAFRAALRVK